MSRLLYRSGVAAARHPWRVIGAWLLIVMTAVTVNAAAGGQADDTFRLPGSESQQAADALEDRFPSRTLYTSNVVFHSASGIAGPKESAAVRLAVERLTATPRVIGVSDPFDAAAGTVSGDGLTAFATVGYDRQQVSAEDFDLADAATQVARAAGVRVEYDGALGYAKGDVEAGGEVIGVAVAVVVLAIAFGSLVAMSLPIVVALTGIVVGSSAIGILSGVVTVPSIAGVVALMLGLGVGIDYALFVLARHRQHLDSGMPVLEAVGRAGATAGLSVLFAGVTVVVAIGGLQVAGIPTLSMMGWASALMVLVTMAAALTLLPALLGLLGRRVNSLRVPLVRRRRADDTTSGSSRWAARVVARPVRYGAVALVLLGVLAVPVLSMRLGFADAGNDGPSTTTRQAYDLLAQGYGPGSNGPLLVAVETGGGTDAQADLQTFTADLRDAAGVALVGDAVLNEAGDLALVAVTPTTAPQDERTAELLRSLRDDVLPAAVAGTDLRATVTGNPAVLDDISTQLQDRLPWFLGAVLGLSFLVLLVVFRSVLVPLKAAVLNLLSVGAAYGVVVAVFQLGWGNELIGVPETVPINPLAPMLMFAILFGLSMDYEVFLISRVRERYLHHGDPGRAVVEGVGSTGRVITSAALIMISVFGAFVLSADVTTKMFGVGLASAVLLDVTLVRMVLVPAAMSLLGHRAWWVPAWLDRTLPTLDLEGGGDEAADEVLVDEQRVTALV